VWTRPDHVLGTPVDRRLLLAHTETVAVAVTGLVAFPTGFDFTLIVVRRRAAGDPATFWRSFQHAFPGGPVPDDFLRLGVQFSDGSSATNLDPLSRRLPASGDTPAGPLLMPGGGGGGVSRHEMRFWVWPLPPPGALGFVCEWPSHGIGETRVEVDAQLLLDAAVQAVPLWPDDEVTAKDEPPG
jgi:hypothetical protein